ncbi:glycosyltransferase [Pelagibacteraceae bacterium]|nr:glycosyltransferase [Pelagibacteraceae bacterium]
MKINTDINLKTDVTFVMSVFNEEYKLANAIDSILNQNYQLWFLVVVNDGSTDNSQKVINHYKNIDERITCIVNKTKKGLAYSLNKAIENSNTKYIARMDADDVALPRRLEAQLNYLDKHPEIDVLGTAAEVVTNDTKKEIVFKPQNHDVIASSIEKINPFFHSSVMMRSSFINQLGGYDPKCLRAQDYDLWLRGIDKFKYHNLQEVLITYLSRNQSFKSIYYGLRIRIINAYRRRRILIGSLKAILVFIYGLYIKTVRSFN